MVSMPPELHSFIIFRKQHLIQSPKPIHAEHFNPNFNFILNFAELTINFVLSDHRSTYHNQSRLEVELQLQVQLDLQLQL